LENLGAASAAHGALNQSGWTIGELDTVGIYDSFTVTLAMLLEEIGICERGEAGADATAGRFDRTGTLPLNTHGGLLSYGHCGVAGGMAHLAEVSRQLRSSCGSRQISGPARRALVHADGGVMSAHVSLAVERP
jgi:acetyl-CoA acetyltransferase